MKNLMMENSFFETLWAKLNVLFGIYNFWIALFLAALGVTFFLLSIRLTRIHRGVDVVANNDKVKNKICMRFKKHLASLGLNESVSFGFEK